MFAQRAQRAHKYHSLVWCTGSSTLGKCKMLNRKYGHSFGFGELLSDSLVADHTWPGPRG